MNAQVFDCLCLILTCFFAVLAIIQAIEIRKYSKANRELKKAILKDECPNCGGKIDILECEDCGFDILECEDCGYVL